MAAQAFGNVHVSVADVIKEIKEAGREDLLPLYFEFLEVAHSAIETNLHSFPIFHAQTVIEEMDALSKLQNIKMKFLRRLKKLLDRQKLQFKSCSYFYCQQ